MMLRVIINDLRSEPAMKNPNDEIDLLVKTSSCEIRRKGDGVAVRLGHTILVFDVVEFAAFAGSCRRATTKLFGNEKPRRVLRRGIRDLQLVVDNVAPSGPTTKP
jgi:hypothetical protein